MSYTQQLSKLDKKTLALINDIVKDLSDTDEVYEENWNKISKKPFKSFKTNKKSRKKTGYYLYSSNADIRTKIKEEHPDESKNIGFVSKLISEQWKNLSEEDKEVYNKQAEEINSQTESESDDNVTKKKSPKRSAYNCYIGNKALRAKVEEESSSEKLSMLEVNKILSAKWKEMTDEEKEVYVKEAEEYNNKLSKKEEDKEEDKEEVNEEVNEEVKKEVKEEVKKKKVVKKKVIKK